jgi:alkylation response protein AidB-like acyl-CoA dehydrogenase
MFSEPGAGSDAAAIRTVAERVDDGGWLVTRQKVWTSVASWSDWGLGPDARVPGLFVRGRSYTIAGGTFRD